MARNNGNGQPYLETIDEYGRDGIAAVDDHPGFITLHHKREPLVIKESYYRGNHRISLRYHYPDRRDGVLRPGKRGVEIPTEALDATIQALIFLRDRIEQEAQDYDEASHGV